MEQKIAADKEALSNTLPHKLELINEECMKAKSLLVSEKKESTKLDERAKKLMIDKKKFFLEFNELHKLNNSSA